MKLSVVINTKNSAKTLEKALKSVKSLADEIVIVDMKSEDDTVKIAKKYTDKVFSHEDVGYVEPARNFAIAKATGDWILILDSDEEVSPGLKEFIMSLMRIDQTELDADCYYVPRRNMIWGKGMEKTGWWPDHILRLFKKGYVEWSDEIHSIPMTTGNVVELPAEDDYAIIHHNYDTVSEFVSRLNRYTDIEANKAHDAQRTTQNGLRLPAGKAGITDSCNLIREFNSELLRRLFASRGIEEGVHGVGLSYLQGMYQLVAELKAWEIEKVTEKQSGRASKMQRSKDVERYRDIESSIAELRSFQRDLNYWIADWNFYNSSGLTKLVWRIRRKLKI